MDRSYEHPDLPSVPRKLCVQRTACGILSALCCRLSAAVVVTLNGDNDGRGGGRAPEGHLTGRPACPVSRLSSHQRRSGGPPLLSLADVPNADWPQERHHTPAMHGSMSSCSNSLGVTGAQSPWWRIRN